MRFPTEVVNEIWVQNATSCSPDLSLHSVSAIVSTVSQGTQDSIRINIAMAYFPQMSNSSVRLVCAYNSFI
jgi:hypothetical protein